MATVVQKRRRRTRKLTDSSRAYPTVNCPTASATARPTLRLRLCPPTNTNHRARVHNCPPSLRFPPLREGNRVGRVGSVPPACRGNLKEGVSISLVFVNCVPAVGISTPLAPDFRMRVGDLFAVE